MFWILFYFKKEMKIEKQLIIPLPLEAFCYVIQLQLKFHLNVSSICYGFEEFEHMKEMKISDVPPAPPKKTTKKTNKRKTKHASKT